MNKVKINTVVAASWDAEGNVLTAAVLGQEPVVFDRRKASSSCRDHAERHGWEQRIRDRAAMSRDPKTGAAATPSEKREAMAGLVAYYEGGATDWTMKGTPRVLTPEQKRQLLDRLAAELGVTVS